ncbi:MAG: Ldh family oxidoreductase [Planctomycetia bacterium]|nr:Ldh family oxidoreductase [Planctomycetia bacterium]
MDSTRIAEGALEAFIVEVFTRLKVAGHVAALAARSLLDASLMGIDSHGIEALDMYVTHLKSGGLSPNNEPARITGHGGAGLWDMRHGMGLAGARTTMEHAIREAQDNSIHLATCRNANHLGACGVYAKMAADAGMIGIVSQQTMASISPWGGPDVRVGASPVAFAAPVENGFPFLFDAGMAAITRHQVKACRHKGWTLPKGVALDAQGEPTQDPEKAWTGQLMPIGAHKGVGLAMALETLSCILSGNRLSTDIASIVDHSEESAGSGIVVMVIDPAAVMPMDDFGKRMREYVDHVESSTPRDPADPPRYPGRREGEYWRNRKQEGIPVSAEALQRFGEIAISLSVRKPSFVPTPHMDRAPQGSRPI